MTELLDITDVAARTGLTARALRFYEGRGLVRPLRTAGGRRIYGAGELARLHAITALKRAGFSLQQIAALLGERAVDLATLVAAQLAAVEARSAELAAARTLLRSVQSRLDRGEPIDVATLCSLIKAGDRTMEHENWSAVADRYLSTQAKEDFAANPPPSDADQADYARRWSELTGRIEAALPLDPASAQAQAFYDEWQALLAPFKAIATPAMAAGVTRMYDHIDEWKGEQQPPFSSAVWQFIKAAGAARPAA